MRVSSRVSPVNLSGAGTTAGPLVVSRGMPWTLRAGVAAYRF
jgi:hypothetical protein